MHTRWIRPAALILLAPIFWLDAVTPMGIAVSALYVAPVLLFVMGGRYWEPLLVAALASVLIVAGAYVTPPGGSVEIDVFNRPLEALVVWFAAALVARYRLTLERAAVHNAAARQARELTLHRLEETRQALDQASIVATTVQMGTITYVNDKFCEIREGHGLLAVGVPLALPRSERGHG